MGASVASQCRIHLMMQLFVEQIEVLVHFAFGMQWLVSVSYFTHHVDEDIFEVEECSRGAC